MGISVEQFRAKIGLFAPVNIKILTKISRRAAASRPPRRLVMVGLATRLTVLNLILMLLLCAGVEQNPGPRTGIRDDQGPITRGNPRQLRLTTEGESVNLESVMDVLNKLTHKVDDVMKSNIDFGCKLDNIDSTLVSVTTHLAEVKLKCEKLESENERLRKYVYNLEDKVDYLENQSRRCNIIFHGVDRATDGETWDDCENVVRKIIKDKMELDESNIVMHRAHRIINGKAIIAKIPDDHDRKRIYEAAKKLKSFNMWITDDFSRLVREKRKNLKPMLTKAREENRRAVLRFDKLIIDDQVFTYDVDKDRVIELDRRRGSRSARAGSHQNVNTDSRDTT